jgi:5'-phosphate synthase pdxT subunit
VLALQGDFAAHATVLRRIGVQPDEIRHAADLSALDALIIPGGESTTLINLMQDEPWFERLREFHQRGGALFGTCAGAILLSRRIHGRSQASLGLLDATIERNAYGRQIDSFERHIDAPSLGTPLLAAFIRAPRFRAIGPDVEVLGRCDDEPVLVRQKRIVAATFHAELTGDDRLHRFFVELAEGGCDADLPEWKARAEGGGPGLRL